MGDPERVKEALLKKQKTSYQGCPGCIVDRRKEREEGIPLKELCLIWIVVLASGNMLLCFPNYSSVYFHSLVNR